MSKKAVRKCFKNDCTSLLSTDIKQILVAPFDELPADMQKLCSFFLHLAPDIESVHSSKIPEELHAELFLRMLQDRHFKYQYFCPANAQIQKELEKGFLDEETLCLNCKRFVCKKQKQVKGQLLESDLDCFLRHIRNAIAHGRVYYLHSGKRVHIVFEDINPKGKLSARIVCIKADLQCWKRTLEAPNNYTN